MTQSPSGPLSENTEVTFTCVTDEAEPTADVVWTVDGNTRSSDNDSTEDGMYNAQMRSSVLTVRVNRTQNNKKVECRVSGMPAINDTTTLNVTCMCIILLCPNHQSDLKHIYILQSLATGSKCQTRIPYEHTLTTPISIDTF